MNRSDSRRRGFTILEVVVVITIGMALVVGALSYLNTAMMRSEGANFIRDFSSFMAQVRADHRYGISKQDRLNEDYAYSAISLDATMSMLDWRHTEGVTYLTPSGVPVRFDWATFGGIGAQRIQVTIDARKNLCRFLIGDPASLYGSFGGTHNLRNVTIVTRNGATTLISRVTAGRFEIIAGAHDLCQNRSLVRMSFDPFGLENRKFTYD